MLLEIDLFDSSFRCLNAFAGQFLDIVRSLLDVYTANCTPGVFRSLLDIDTTESVLGRVQGLVQQVLSFRC